jgi:hypothetical protein
MKIIVNELPESPENCLFNYNSPATRRRCCKLSNEPMTCNIGSEDFKCPFLVKFKARAFEYYHDYSGATTGYTNIPVQLLENEDD